MKVKSSRPDEAKKGVVYEVPCADYQSVYISETGHSLQMRIKEHKYAVRKQDTRNGIAAHAWSNQGTGKLPRSEKKI